MKKPRLPKINSIHYGGPWIALSFAVGLLIPWIVWLITGVWPFWLTRIGGTSLVGFIILFTLEMNQDFGKPSCDALSARKKKSPALKTKPTVILLK